MDTLPFLETAVERYGVYARHVLGFRHFGEGKDGAKPVQRRALWSMKRIGAVDMKHLTLAAEIMGFTTGNFHPHEDCLSGETLIFTLDGNTHKIKNLVGTDPKWILAYDEKNNKYIPALAHSWRIGQYTKSYYVITLSDGSKIKSTKNHPFHVVGIDNNTWIKTENLKTGMLLQGASLDFNYDYVRLHSNSEGSFRELYNIVGKHFFKKKRGFIFHHIDENKQNNLPENLIQITKSKHALIHKNYIKNYSVGRETMFDSSSSIRKSVKNKNSILMSEYNKHQGLMKAISILKRLRKKGINWTPSAYNKERINIYNGTTLRKLEMQGISWKKLCLLVDSFQLDTSKVKGLVSAAINKSKKNLLENKLVESSNNNNHLYAQKFRSALIIKRMLIENQNLSWKNYEFTRKKLAHVLGGSKTVGYRAFIKRSTLIKNNIINKNSSIQDLMKILSPTHLLYISKIEEVVKTKPKPMYDFTVDKYHNLCIATKVGEKTTLVVAHNSSVFNAMVNMSQSNLKYPLIVGIGNWGSHNADAGAPRYVKCYLSKYANTMFDPDEMQCIPMDKSYNGKQDEPRYLPVKLPHLLLGGCSSIAPGFKGEIPPCNVNWVVDSLFSIVLKKKIILPKTFAYRWGGKLIKLESSWLHKGTGSAEFAPTIKIEKGVIIFSSLAPNLKLFGKDSIESRLENDAAFGGLAQEAPNKGELIRIVIRIKRGHNIEDFYSRIVNLCKTKEHYSFLQIKQLINKKSGDLDYEPIIQGIEDFLYYWILWRKNLVSNTAKYRIEEFRKDIKKIYLLLHIVDKRKELLKIMDNAKTRDDICKRTMIVLKCSEVEAREAMEYPWPRLATLEILPLKEKISNLEKQIRYNESIIAKPYKRLLEDAENTVDAINKTREDIKALELDTSKKRK
jgi:hypothetical protein